MSGTTFAEMIRTARLELGLSQAGLAERVRTTKRPDGVWPTYIGQIEKGQKLPSEDVCVCLAQALGLDPTQVLLAAHQARADGPLARRVLDQLRAAASDPAVARVLAPAGASRAVMLRALLEACEQGDLAVPEEGALLQRLLRHARQHDLGGVTDALERMTDAQWETLVEFVEAQFGVPGMRGPDSRPPAR